MAVAPTPVAAAPDAPDRAQRATFSARATAFFDWIKNTFVAGVNALASNVYANAQDAASSAANAVAQSASATAQAGIATAQAAAATSAAATATTQAGVATTQAASITTAAATSTAKADVATAKAAEATAAAATATAIVLGVSTGYPIIRPSLTLDFANSQIFDPRITFTRASSGTRTNERGLIESLASGVPRIDFDPVTGECRGLLIEEARTNLLLRSAEFDNASWTKTRATITANATTAPDGTLTGDKIVSDATAANTHDIRQQVTVSDTTFAFSIYFKAAECTWALIEVQNAAAQVSRARAWFNLATGVVGAGNTADAGVTYVSHSITNAGGGWYRCSLTCTTALTGLQIFIEPTTGDNITDWNGNSTDGAFVWGAQLEVGAFPTSYILSGGAATTRAADVAVMTGVDFASWYRQDEGTFVVNGKCSQPVPAAQYPRLFQVGTSSANTMAVLFDGGRLYALSVFGGAEVFNAGATRTATVDNRVSMAYKRNDYALSINGGVAAADTTGDVPTVTRLAVGLSVGAWGFFNGTISDLTYYPLRLTNAELQALSAQ